MFERVAAETALSKHARRRWRNFMASRELITKKRLATTLGEKPSMSINIKRTQFFPVGTMPKCFENQVLGSIARHERGVLLATNAHNEKTVVPPRIEASSPATSCSQQPNTTVTRIHSRPGKVFFESARHSTYETRVKQGKPFPQKLKNRRRHEIRAENEVLGKKSRNSRSNK
jgi:hypothetical protein